LLNLKNQSIFIQNLSIKNLGEHFSQFFSAGVFLLFNVGFPPFVGLVVSTPQSLKQTKSQFFATPPNLILRITECWFFKKT